MKILGCDIATDSGFALYDPDMPLSAIHTWTFTADGDTNEEKAWKLGRHVQRMVKRYQPDFFAIEQPFRNVARYQKKSGGKQSRLDLAQAGNGAPEMTVNPQAVIIPNLLVGAVMGIAGAYGKPCTIITEGTWRKFFLGFGRKRGWKRDDYKQAAIDRCLQLNIAISGRKAANDADAVGVAVACTDEDYFKIFKMKREAA